MYTAKDSDWCKIKISAVQDSHVCSGFDELPFWCFFLFSSHRAYRSLFFELFLNLSLVLRDMNPYCSLAWLVPSVESSKVHGCMEPVFEIARVPIV